MVSASFVKVLLRFMFVNVSAKARMIDEFIYLFFEFMYDTFIFIHDAGTSLLVVFLFFRASQNFKCKDQDSR